MSPIRIATFALLAALPPLVAAQDYPSKPVHVYVPSSAGGASDIAARLVSPKLAEALGQPFVVENRVTSGGIVGTAQLAKAPADGYAIMMTFDTFASNPHLYQELPYDVAKDFAPIMLMVRYPQILVVHPSLGVKTVPEFVAYARTNAGKLNYGSAGPASSSRLAFELFKDAAGINVVAVHYKGGGPAINDLVSGTVQVMLIQAGGAIGQNVRSGKLVGLATSGRVRSPHFPDLPTIGEFYPGFETTSWVGAIAPAGTPRTVIDKLNGTLAKILSEPDIKSRFDLQSAEIVASTPEQLGELIRSEYAKWGKVIREKNIKAD
ncbi:MAG TPA: tripartite tricarboxylate transporter substrate binding protein [Burkholderiales bacterium]|jgi:tripartite-type tricarboxylate transporter receptor subunit TctC|nr:tripartite tricarboxylate transporter substrate binding protein [Burkholderiales bacterium]